jgi:hypothetical protein
MRGQDEGVPRRSACARQLTYERNLLFKYDTEIKMSGAITSRSILVNHSATWLSQGSRWRRLRTYSNSCRPTRSRETVSPDSGGQAPGAPSSRPRCLPSPVWEQPLVQVRPSDSHRIRRTCGTDSFDRLSHSLGAGKLLPMQRSPCLGFNHLCMCTSSFLQTKRPGRDLDRLYDDSHPRPLHRCLYVRCIHHALEWPAEPDVRMYLKYKGNI